MLNGLGCPRCLRHSECVLTSQFPLPPLRQAEQPLACRTALTAKEDHDHFHEELNEITVWKCFVQRLRMTSLTRSSTCDRPTPLTCTIYHHFGNTEAGIGSIYCTSSKLITAEPMIAQAGVQDLGILDFAHVLTRGPACWIVSRSTLLMAV